MEFHGIPWGYFTREVMGYFTWESYLTELSKLPWTSLYLTSLELENYDEDMKERVLYALNYGTCGLKVPLTPIFFFSFSKRIQNLVKIKKRIE